MVRSNQRGLAITDGAMILDDSQYSRILVVDSTDELDVTTNALRSDGWQVVEATTFDRALAQLRSDAIHAIVVDPFNIEPGGLDAVIDIRRMTNVPILVTTSLADRTVLVAALRLGVDDYVTKPVWPSEIAASVRRRRRGAPTEARVRRAGAARTTCGHGIRPPRDLRPCMARGPGRK
jgi:DNA-binding response OmpR family regulator